MNTLQKFGKWLDSTTFLFTGNEDEPGTLPEELRSFSSVIKSIEIKYDTNIALPEWLNEFNLLNSINIRGFNVMNLGVVNELPNLTSLSIYSRNANYAELESCIPKLSYIKLEGIYDKNLSIFSNAHNCRILILEECDTNIDFIIRLDKLKEFSLLTNSPNVVIPEIWTLALLTSLEINNNHADKYNNLLYDDFYKSAGNAISKCLHLRHLSVHSNIAHYIDFYKLKKLWDLRYISGSLEHIPDDVIKIESLLSIIIESTSLKEIPSNIHLLSKLQRMYINKCNIDSIPASIIKLNDLSELDLSDNRIEEIPISLALMPKLKTFNYESNPISKDSIFYNNSLLGVFKQLKQQEQDTINVGVIQMPEAIRSAVQEYLVYFDEYYEEISGKKVGFKVSKHEIGLRIEVELTQELDISDIQQALAKYTQYLLDKKFNVENNVEVDKLVKDLQILKLTLETKANHFDQQMKILELRHQIVNDENIYLRQIVATFASKENVFVINQQNANRNSPKLLNNNNINVENNFPTDAFLGIAKILDEIGEDKELSEAAAQIVDSTQDGKRSVISSALSNFVSILTNSIDKAHIFLVDAPEVVEKLKKSLELAKIAALTHHYHEVGKVIGNIINMF